MKNLFKTHFLLIAFIVVMSAIGIHQVTSGTFVSLIALFLHSIGFFFGLVVFSAIVAMPFIFLRAI